MYFADHLLLLLCNYSSDSNPQDNQKTGICTVKGCLPPKYQVKNKSIYCNPAKFSAIQDKQVQGEESNNYRVQDQQLQDWQLQEVQDHPVWDQQVHNEQF